MNKAEIKKDIDKKNITKKNNSVKESSEDAYSQINQIAFQQNFKALIGHFKKDLNYSTPVCR